MNRYRIFGYAACAILALSLAGCFGGTKVVTQERTIIHNDGIVVITNIAHIGIRLESDGEAVPAEKMSKKEFADWSKGRDSRTLVASVEFDDTLVVIGNDKVGTRGEFNKSVDAYNDRIKEINKFVSGSKKKMDIRKWQK